MLASLAGCVHSRTGQRVIYLDGAGWYTGHRPVRTGLESAGYTGSFERFGWSSMLGPLPDHLVAGPGHPKVAQLADHLTDLRRNDPYAPLIVVGLSAGTSIIIHALERLPDDVMVTHVVLLSPSVSGSHNLTAALEHVAGRLYATTSPYDAILKVAPSAGVQAGAPAGIEGFSLPRFADEHTIQQYDKAVMLPWRPEYLAWGWDGSHTGATTSSFIRTVIAPRIVHDIRIKHPLDVPITASAGR